MLIWWKIYRCGKQLVPVLLSVGFRKRNGSGDKRSFQGEVLANENGTAPGIYLPANVSPATSSPHLFLLPGPPRELEPMFRAFVLPILRQITASAGKLVMRNFRVANLGESIIERKIGAAVLAIPGIELGYCARLGEADVRIIGSGQSVAQAEKTITDKLGNAIFTTDDESLA